MRYGAMNFPVKPILDEIDVIVGEAFDFVELTLDPPQAHYSTIRELKQEILARLSDSETSLVCHLPTFVFTADLTESIRRASLEETILSLETARELDAEKVVVHPGYIGGMGSFVLETSRQYALQSLAAVSEKASELDICLCLENMFPRYQSFVEPEDFADILRMFPSLKLTLDTGHANIEDQGGDRLVKYLQQYGNRIGHVHISDNKGKRDDHIPVGEGSVNFKEFISALKSSGYDDTMTLEIFTDNRQNLLRSRERIQNLLADEKPKF